MSSLRPESRHQILRQVGRPDHQTKEETKGTDILRYSETKLVEINSHSLFSKWFSESGKLVQKLFSHVTRMVESESTFVVVMIGASRYCCLLPAVKADRVDEVESLTSARTANGSEPGDALRVSDAWRAR